MLTSKEKFMNILDSMWNEEYFKNTTKEYLYSVASKYEKETGKPAITKKQEV